MELSKQVCSLGQAKKLKELGISLNSLFQYEIKPKHGIPISKLNDSRLYYPTYNSALYSDDYQFPALSVAELGVILIINDDLHFIHSYYNEHYGNWGCLLEIRDDTIDYGFRIGKEIEENTEAEVRAEMLIYCIENNLITVEEVNARLTA